MLTVVTGRRLVLRADAPTDHPIPTSLVARERELASLRDALRASAVDARVVVIGGDAGCGKTALLTRFRRDARNAGISVVEGACVEIEARRPFGAFSDLITSCSRVFGSGRIERALGGRGVLLQQLVSPSAIDRVGAVGDRYQVHGAILGLFTDLAADGPFAVFLEDLHWADEASLQLFGYLARRLRGRPVLLVATYRADELDRRHPLRPLLADLRKARLVDDLHLSSLDQDGTSALIHARLALRDPAPLDLRDFRDIVHARCEGNPLHTEETIDTLRQRNWLTYVDGAWSCDVAALRKAIPATVADGVVARWSALSAETRQILLVASSIGHHFNLELLADVCDTPPPRLAGLIHEAIDAQLVREGITDESLSFHHALTREALQQQLLRPERVSLHARIAASLEHRQEQVPVNARELAYHLDESGDLMRASRYHAAAAREAAAITDYASAARSMERAIATSVGADSEQGPRQLELVGYLRLSGNDPRARRAAFTALETGERAGDARLQGQALLELYALDYRNSDEAPDVGRLDRALALLKPLGPTPELARALSTRAAVSARLGDAIAAMAYAEHAQEIAAIVAKPAELAYATMQVGLAFTKQGKLAEAIAACRDAVDIARRADLVDELYNALMTLRVQLVVAGASSAEQRALQSQMRALARSHGLAKQGWIVRELSDLHQEANWDEFLRLLPRVPEPELSDFEQPKLMAIFTRVARGGPGELGDLEGARLRTEYRSSALSASWAAKVLLLAGQAAESVELASEITDEATRARHWGLIPASVAHAIGLFAARECNDPRAQDQFVSSLLTERPLPAAANFNRMFMALAHGDVAERAERNEDALAAYQTALEECERTQFNSDVMYLMTMVRKRLADLFLHRSPADIAAAQAQLDAMLPYWQAGKAAWYLEQLRTWAEGLGLVFPASVEPLPTAPSTPHRLTPRELEVAQLIAQGLTNREIGMRLTLSVRTAESHVQQIRAKLGFKTRAQIASWVTVRYGVAR